MREVEHNLDDGDATCLAAVREVLEQHGKLSRFGVFLLHRHFKLQESECMLETVDSGARTLTVHPISKDDLGQVVATQWSLASPDPHQWCSAYCDYKDGEHKTWHKSKNT